MPNTVIVGAQWGDEGKAKVIDYLTEKSDIIIRFHGGANAGHTVVVGDQKYVFHMVPSGIIYPKKSCVLGNGIVFDAEQFIKEVDELAEKGISIEGRLKISGLAHMVLPYHKALDNALEAVREGKIGTTGKGIGPAYSDKVNRSGIRVADLLSWDTFCEKVTTEFNNKVDLITNYHKQECTLSLEAILETYKELRERLLPLIDDTATYLFDSLQNKKELLFEGAQGTFLDVDHGTYPYVTSSNVIAGAACTGTGMSPKVLDHIVGIVKTYTTRVGNGPFPTELHDETGEKLRAIGHEFGATTGRKRRCGWFDSVLLRKAVQLNGFTRFALTKLDVLNSFEEIKICTHYEIDGEKTDVYPSDMEKLERAKPVYETLPGWNCDISDCTSFDDLPENAKKYINRLQELCYNVPILILSIGPERSETIEIDKID